MIQRQRQNLNEKIRVGRIRDNCQKYCGRKQNTCMVQLKERRYTYEFTGNLRAIIYWKICC